MLVALVVLAVIITALLVVLAVVLVQALAWRRLYGKPVIVNLRDGSAIAGVMWRRRGDVLALRSAVLHEHGQSANIDGEAVLERARVAWIQVPPSVEPRS